MTDVKNKPDVNDKSMKSQLSGVASQLPLGRLRDEASGLGQALFQRGMGKASERVESMTGRLNDVAEGKSTKTKTALNVAQGDSPAKAGVKAVGSKVGEKVKDAVSTVGEKLTGGGGGKGGKLKVTNILESLDVPVPREVAYRQWTSYEDFPSFMKKVENVKQDDEVNTTWKAQIFWSHRRWTAEIIDQVPPERIVWKSTGDKGHVDGAVTFHELSPDLTRINLVLEYYPKGLFEHTGNIWRAQGRRARLEFKHFARHVSTNTILHQDEVEGWPGEIHDGEVTNEDALSKAEGEEQEGQEQEGQEQEDKGQEKGSEQKGQKEKGSEQKGSSDGPEEKGQRREGGEGARPAKKAAKRPAQKGGTEGGAKGPSGQAPAKRPAKKAAKKAAKRPAGQSSG